MYIGPWQEFQLAQGTRPTAPSGAMLDNVRKILEEAASSGDFDPEAVAKLGLLLAANSNKAQDRPSSVSSRASTNSRASLNSAFSKTSSRAPRRRHESPSQSSHSGPSSTSNTWTHNGVRLPPKDRIVNGVRIRANTFDVGERAAAESVSLRVSPIDAPQSARTSHTPRSSRSSIRSRASEPMYQHRESIDQNRTKDTEKQNDTKAVASILKAERRARFHKNRKDLDNLWGDKWKRAAKAKEVKPKDVEGAVANVNTMKAIYLDALGPSKDSCVDPVSSTPCQSISPLRSPRKSSPAQRKPLVQDMNLTKDHIGMVAKYFQDDALELLSRSIDVNKESPISRESQKMEGSLPLAIDTKESRDSTSPIPTPKTGDSRYQSVDALLDWAKDLDIDSKFLDSF